jgi:hypothetical protein
MTNIFYEALSHSRRKTILQEEVLALPEVHEVQRYSKMTFEKIYTEIHRICEPINGIGKLAMYDITAAICRANNIIIDRVYIIGGGPKRAIKILGIKPKIHKFEQISLQYVQIHDISTAFITHGYKINSMVKQSMNGDDWESYICKWQKNIM